MRRKRNIFPYVAFAFIILLHFTVLYAFAPLLFAIYEAFGLG